MEKAMGLTKNDRHIISRAGNLTKNEIDRLDNSGISHYTTGLFNCLEHVCPHSEFHTGRLWDETQCSGDCVDVLKCTMIVNLLCRVKPAGMILDLTL